MCVWTLRDSSSSKPTSDPARSPTCVRLSVSNVFRELPVPLEEQPLYNTSKGLDVSHRIPFPPNKKYYKLSGWEVGSCAVLDTVWGGFPVGSRWAPVGSAWVPLALPCRFLLVSR